MAIIPQTGLLDWTQLDQRSDLDRVRWVLENMPDEALMQRLEDERGQGRNDYPLRVMWNCLLAMQVPQHSSISSFLRELARNAELCQTVGFSPFLPASKLPQSHNFSRFEAQLRTHADETQAAVRRPRNPCVDRYQKYMERREKDPDPLSGSGGLDCLR